MSLNTQIKKILQKKSNRKNIYSDLNKLFQDYKHEKELNLNSLIFDWDADEKAVFFRRLGGFLKDTQINSINIARNGLDARDLEKFISHYKNTNVISINASDNVISNEGMAALVKKLKNKNVISINLTRNLLNDEAIVELGNGLKANKYLLQLKLQDNAFSSNALAHFSSCLPECNLTKLNIKSNKINESDAKAFAENLARSKVIELDASYCQLGNKSTNIIVEKLKRSKIEKLNLAYNHLDDGAVIKLTSSLRLSPVRYLNLRENKITPNGIYKLLAALKHSKVTELRADFNNKEGCDPTLLAKALDGTAITVGAFDLSSADPENEALINSILKSNQIKNRLVRIYRAAKQFIQYPAITPRRKAIFGVGISGALLTLGLGIFTSMVPFSGFYLGLLTIASGVICSALLVAGIKTINLVKRMMTRSDKITYQVDYEHKREFALKLAAMLDDKNHENDLNKLALKFDMADEPKFDFSGRCTFQPKKDKSKLEILEQQTKFLQELVNNEKLLNVSQKSRIKT